MLLPDGKCLLQDIFIDFEVILLKIVAQFHPTKQRSLLRKCHKDFADYAAQDSYLFFLIIINLSVIPYC